MMPRITALRFFTMDLLGGTDRLLLVKLLGRTTNGTVARRRSRSRAASRGRSSQLHLRQHRAAQETVRVGDRLGNLEVVVALADEDLDGFARGLHRRREVARLAL